MSPRELGETKRNNNLQIFNGPPIQAGAYYYFWSPLLFSAFLPPFSDVGSRRPSTNTLVRAYVVGAWVLSVVASMRAHTHRRWSLNAILE